MNESEIFEEIIVTFTIYNTFVLGFVLKDQSIPALDGFTKRI